MVEFIITFNIYENLAINESYIFDILSTSNLNKNNFSMDVYLPIDTRERAVLIMWLIMIMTLCSWPLLVGSEKTF